MIDDVVCDAPKHEPSANDDSVDVSPYQATVAIPSVDVDIDSDNNNGTDAPARSEDEDRIEENVGPKEYGKFVMVNHNDDDGDGKPDYADLENAKEGQFVPLVVEIPYLEPQ